MAPQLSRPAVPVRLRSRSVLSLGVAMALAVTAGWLSVSASPAPAAPRPAVDCATTHISITPDAALPNAAFNVPYSQQLTANGAQGAVTFSVIAGAPPSGLTVSAGGVLSGTPNAPSAAAFRVQAVDSN